MKKWPSVSQILRFPPAQMPEKRTGSHTCQKLFSVTELVKNDPQGGFIKDEYCS
jgi:hypothetical protein